MPRRKKPQPPDPVELLSKVRENAMELVRSIEIAQEGTTDINLTSLYLSFAHSVEVVSDSFLVRACEIIEETSEEVA